MKSVTATIALGDVVDLIMGQAPSSKDTNFDGRGIPFVKVGEFGIVRPVIREWTTNPLRIARRTDVLLCVVGATCGKINLGEECAIGRSVAAIRPDSSKLDQFYLFYFMMTLVERLRSGSVGAAQTVISKDMVESVQIPFPPLHEQQRIVRILDEAFEGIITAKTNAQKNLQNARAVFASYSNWVFCEHGAGWMEKTLQEVADDNCTLSYGIVQPGDEYVNGLPIVRPTDLTKKVILISGLKRIDPKLAEGYKRTTLFGGELLLCVRGSTGVVSIASSELVGANVTRGIVPIRFNGLLDPNFGFYLMNSDEVQGQIREKTYGAALMQINIRDLRNIKLSFPSSEEQKQIVTKLDSLSEKTEQLAKVYERKVAALDGLKMSLLNEVFSRGL